MNNLDILDRYKILNSFTYTEMGEHVAYFEIVDTYEDLRYELFWAGDRMECPNVTAEEYKNIKEFITRIV